MPEARTFPNARFHVQDAEMAFATGRHVCDHGVRAPFDGEPVAQLVRKLYADHVVFHDGDEEFAPGIRLCLAHGHTAGLMVVVLRDGARHCGAGERCRAPLRQYHPQAIPFPIFVDEADYARAQARVDGTGGRLARPPDPRARSAGAGLLPDRERHRPR
jgi:hypothetical protein